MPRGVPMPRHLCWRKARLRVHVIPYDDSPSTATTHSPTQHLRLSSRWQNGQNDEHPHFKRPSILFSLNEVLRPFTSTSSFSPYIGHPFSLLTIVVSHCVTATYISIPGHLPRRHPNLTPESRHPPLASGILTLSLGHHLNPPLRP